MSDILKATCSIEDIRFYKDDFGIVSVSIDGIKEGKPKYNTNKQIIVKGTMIKPIVGNLYNLVAEYVDDAKWGGQYNIISMYSAITFTIRTIPLNISHLILLSIH